MTTRNETLYGISQSDWLAMLLEINPNGEWSIRGSEIRGLCPYHTEGSPSFHIVREKQFAFCFGCQTHVSDPVRIVQKLTGLNYPTALRKHFIERFNLKLNRKKQEELLENAVKEDLSRAVSAACKRALNYAYDHPDDEAYAYVRPAIEYLEARNVPRDYWDVLELGVFPTRRHLYDHIPAELRQSWEILFNPYMEVAPDMAGMYGGWIVFSYMTAPDTISGFKLRQPDRSKQNFVWIRDQGDDLGFWGMHLYRTYYGAKDVSYMVEGEFDAAAAMVFQLEKFPSVETIFLAGGGGAADNCDAVADVGVARLCVVGDNDKAGMRFVSRCLSNTDHNKFKATYGYVWPAELSEIKDIDEAVQLGLGQEFFDSMADGAKVAHIWAGECIALSVASIPRDSIQERINVIKQFSQAVKVRVELEALLNSMSDIAGVSAAHLIRDLATPDTEDGYKELVRRELEKLVVPIARRSNTTTLCYSHVQRETFDINLEKSRTAKIAIQNLVLLTELYGWCSRMMGIPDWIQIKGMNKNGPVMRTEEEKSRLMEQIFDRAIQELVAPAPNMSDLQVRRRGVHYANAMHDPLDKHRLIEGSADKRLYVVNGHDVYVGHMYDDRDELLFQQLTLPLHGNYLFETNQPRWSKNVGSIEDLSTPCTTDPREMFIAIRDAIRKCWVFECESGNEDLQPTFIAAYMFTIVVASAFPQVMMVFLNAPSHSGKSTLLGGLFRGKDYPQMHLCEHVTGYDDYSAAGIAQNMGGSSLMVTLDEFESPDDAKSTRKKQIVQVFLDMTRNMGGGVTQVRGGPTSLGKENYFRFPVMAAGIHPLKDQVDANRWNTVRLVHQAAGMTPPEVAMLELISEEKIQEYQRALTLVPIQNIKSLLHHHHALELAVLKDRAIVYRESRFMKSLLPVLSVLKWLGEDWVDFGQRYTTQYETLISTAAVPPHEQLFTAIFNTRKVQFPELLGSMYTIAQCLLDDQLKANLNASACGAFFCPEHPEYVILHMPTIAHNLLSTHTIYAGATNGMTLLEQLKPHKNVIYKPALMMTMPAMVSCLQRAVFGFKPNQSVMFKISDIVPELYKISSTEVVGDEEGDM